MRYSGGKSEQGRARWRLTTAQSDLRESATENIQPMERCSNWNWLTGNGEMVR